MLPIEIVVKLLTSSEQLETCFDEEYDDDDSAGYSQVVFEVMVDIPVENTH